MNYPLKTISFSTRYKSFIVYSLSLIVVLAGCKKVETTKTYTVPNTTSQSAIASDEVIVNSELDQFVDDAITVLSNHNASIESTTVDSINPSVLEINYYGKEPDGVKARSGTDSIHLNTASWNTIGATATLSFKIVNVPAYEVSYASLYSYEATPSTIIDTATLTLSGSLTITNVYGGLLQNVTSSSDSLVIHIRTTNVSFTFNDQAAVVQLYPLNINEIRSFTFNSAMYATTRGDTALGGYTNIGSWGTDVFGNSYYSSTTAAIVQNISNIYLLSYNPLSGTKVIEGISQPITIQYGVDTQGNHVSIGNIPYGFFISWNNGGENTDILPYYY